MSHSKFTFLLDGASDDMMHKMPPPFEFLPRRCNLYPSTENRLSLNVASSFVSAINNRSTILSVNNSLISSNLYLMLFTFKYAVIKFLGCNFLASLSSLKRVQLFLFTPVLL